MSCPVVVYAWGDSNDSPKTGMKSRQTGEWRRSANPLLAEFKLMHCFTISTSTTATIWDTSRDNKIKKSTAFSANKETILFPPLLLLLLLPLLNSRGLISHKQLREGGDVCTWFSASTSEGELQDMRSTEDGFILVFP